uniref:Peptidase S1 domain-containing protein n=1 Tax=Anopheles epiroticus TaxID=199890 RepID=A0A182PWT6_9DIPT
LANEKDETLVKEVGQSGRIINGNRVEIANFKYVVIVRGVSNFATSGGVLFQVIRIAIHPSYILDRGPGVADYNVAILRVRTNAFINRLTRIPFATAEVQIGARCLICGWGRINLRVPEPSAELRFVFMNIVSQSACSARWASSRFQTITSNMICVGSRNVDICYGDNGAPLVCNGVLVGVASFSNPSCDGSRPAGFTKIIAPNITAFIRRETRV